MNTRQERLAMNFQALRIDGLLVPDGTNMKYLTGFDGGTGDGLVLVTESQTVLITDARYEEMKQRAEAGLQVVLTRDYLHAAVDLVSDLGLTVLGFESSLPYYLYDQLDELVEADIVPMTELVETLRQVKDQAEIERLRVAGVRTIAGIESVLPKIHAGVSERQVANWIDAAMRDLGASGPSFDTIVASGVRAALPHGAATEKRLAEGELVTIDCGYFFDGYTSDVTRTVSIGPITPELAAVYELVKAAHEADANAIKAGVTGHEIDAVGRQLISDAGYGAQFNHGTGHGIGLAIHEGPAITRGIETQVPRDAVITIEPGVYLPGVGGVRLENDYLVTDEGAENLTDGPLDLITLD